MQKHLKRHWLIAAAAASCLAVGAFGYAWAQGILALTSPTGTELITVLPLQANGQPAATQATIALNNARATTSSQLSTATTGTVVANALANRFIFNGSAPGTVTVDGPATPPDGSMIEIVNGSAGAATAITFATTDSSTIVGTAACGALTVGGSCEFMYIRSNTTWYRLR